MDNWGISCEIALTWKPQDLTDDKSRLVQVMAWCHQATSHYLSQCWPSSLSPNGVTRPQRVNTRLPYNAYKIHITICMIRTQFFRQHFQMYFLEIKPWCYYQNFSQVCSLRSVDNKSALVQVMAWCHQVISHCLNQWSECVKTDVDMCGLTGN